MVLVHDDARELALLVRRVQAVGVVDRLVALVRFRALVGPGQLLDLGPGLPPTSPAEVARVVMDKHHKLIREAVTRMHEETHLSKHQYRVMDYYDKQRQIRDSTERHVPRTMKTGMSAIALHGWQAGLQAHYERCLLYTSPSPRDRQKSRMPSSA